jgi:hypothetical protein
LKDFFNARSDPIYRVEETNMSVTDIVEMQPIGTAPIRLEVAMTAQEAVDLHVKQSERVFILRNVSWQDGKAVIEFAPGNGVAAIIDPGEPAEQMTGS